jgi:hypothetical protein
VETRTGSECWGVGWVADGGEGGREGGGTETEEKTNMDALWQNKNSK